jgi:hypothetical protein
MGDKIEIPDKHHTILGLHAHLKQKYLKQESQNWVFYMFCMSLLQTFPQNFEFKRWIPLEKIKVADISIILERSQKCVTGKIVLKMLGKNQNGTTELP